MNVTNLTHETIDSANGGATKRTTENRSYLPLSNKRPNRLSRFLYFSYHGLRLWFLGFSIVSEVGFWIAFKFSPMIMIAGITSGLNHLINGRILEKLPNP